MNIIIITLDDVGVEQFVSYGEGGSGTYGYGSTTSFTTAISGGQFGGATDTWTAGVQFMRYTGMQLCSPTRASWITGRYPFRHGCGDIVREGDDSTQGAIRESEVTFWRALRVAGYATAQVGKLHLANPSNGMRDYARRIGIDYYAGNLSNLDQTDTQELAGTTYSEGYYAWPQTAGGRDEVCRAYHTTWAVDAALAWVKRQTGPYVLHLSLYGAHVPFINNATTNPIRFNAPPDSLYDGVTWSTAFLATHTTTQHTMHAFRAALEACNTEVNRFMAGLPVGSSATTTVFYLSDNGTTASVYQHEVNPSGPANYVAAHAKDTPYEGGIRAPLAIFGAGVPAGGVAYTEIVSAVDIYSTVMELAGVDEPTDRIIDGVSLVPVLEGDLAPVRTYAYSEWFQPNGAEEEADRTSGEWSVQSNRYKVLRNSLSGTLEMYDLLPDGVNYSPMEVTNLTPAGDTSGLTVPELAAYNELTEYRAELLATGADIL